MNAAGMIMTIRHSTRTAAEFLSPLQARGVTGLADVRTVPEGRRVVVMCAEAKWWQCHRQLIADALVARGIDVRHILSAREPAPHQLTPFARVAGSAVSYPALV